MLIDPTLCSEVPSTHNTVLTALLCIGTFLSYLPQHIKILTRRSSDGISPYFILLGTIGAGSNITNIILLQFISLQCCTVQSLGTCVASLLGILQVVIQGSMFYITFVLYMSFFPDQNKYASPQIDPPHPEPLIHEEEAANHGVAAPNSQSEEETAPLIHPLVRGTGQYSVEWQTALWVATAVAAHGVICIFMSLLLVTAIGPYASPTRTWASLLGLFSLCLTCLQFFPQIIKTWRARTVGALSIPMMLMQTPGGYIFAYSIAIRPGVNWSSWISTFVAATLQAVLLVLCLVFDAREKSERASNHNDDNEAEVEDDGNPERDE